MSCWRFCWSHFYGWIKLHPFHVWYVKLVKHFTRTNNIKGYFLCHTCYSNLLISQSIRWILLRAIQRWKSWWKTTQTNFQFTRKNNILHIFLVVVIQCHSFHVCAMKRRTAVLQSSCAISLCVSARARSLNGLVTHWSIRHRTGERHLRWYIYCTK